MDAVQPRLAPLRFTKFMCEIIFSIYHELYGEGNLLSLRSDSIVCEVPKKRGGLCPAVDGLQAGFIIITRILAIKK